MPIPRAVVAAAVAALLSPGAARAHAMSADVVVHADAVRVVVYFDDDTPADRAAVTVTDAAGNAVAAGATDDRGVWAFPRPAAGEYRLTAAAAGHTAERRFAVAPAPAPDAPPVEFAAPRRDPAVGLAAGAGGLLAASALWWFVRRPKQPPA